MNHVGLVGRTTKDANIRQLSEGRIQTSFVLAVNRTFKNSEGTIDADFIQCSAWGKTAELIAKYCGKGSLIGIKGRLQSRTYTNRDNQKVYTMEVYVEDVRFYILKAPNKAELAATAPPISKDFVLPEHETEYVKQF
ncbi:single-stranded DNA-binding protein [Solibacillus sp. FSL W7-1464]|uniref:single-stranded DNA-binding protein n=1 Tax=Solibacillus sp. FSL W7-1464 TaxID=2921706 RepID=UPI0030F80A35